MISKNLPLDKVKHFFAGLLIASLFGVASFYILPLLLGSLLTPMSAALCGLAAAILIGTAKEAIWDNWMGRGVEDKYDAFSTMFGGLIGAVGVFFFIV